MTQNKCELSYWYNDRNTRACLIAQQLAQHCDFFSFGTNDLTQLTYGFSRDDGKIYKRVY